MHWLGVAGMPRRVPDYPDAFLGWNVLSSIGSGVSLVAIFGFFWILYITLTAGPASPRSPWTFMPIVASPTIEWLLPSPPAFHSFLAMPVVKYTG